MTQTQLTAIITIVATHFNENGITTEGIDLMAALLAIRTEG